MEQYKVRNIGVRIMKKIIIGIISFILLSMCAVNANELRFEPVGGGKFIYCNNPEGIDDDFILNGNTPRWIMNNTGLSPDLYHIYISHFNYTGNGTPGYDIEVDMAMTAKEDSVLTIHKAFFETQQNYGYYENWERKVKESDWGMLSVCANMLDIPLCDVRGDDFYSPWGYEPVTVEIKKGDRLWLSDYISNYQKVTFGKGVHIQALVEIESGEMDFDIGAVRATGFWKYRLDIPESIEFGEYRWDYTLKGVADTLPEVEADIEYTITDEIKDGERIPVLLKNQYIPEGHTVTGWYTHLNPQNDIWSKKTAAESDILTLRYEDDGKIEHYGDAVLDSEKDNIWVFDTKRSAVRKYESRFGEEKSFKPNFLLTTEKDNHEYACNIGNFGVATTYNMSIANDTDEVKYCNLILTAASEVIAYETDSDGNKTYGYVKDLTAEKVKDNMLSHKIQPNSTDKFKFTIILPVNYNSGILNELSITNENIQAVDFEEKKLQVAEQREKNDYRGTKEFYGEYVESIYPRFPEATDEKVWKSRGSYEYLRGRNNGIIRWKAWDGAPDWYYNLWKYASTVYMLDDGYNITAEYTFPSLPCGASFCEDYFYIKTARDGVFKSKDGKIWEKTDEPMPEYVPYYDLEYASEWAVPELETGWELGIRLDNIAGERYNFNQPMLREDFCELAVQLLDALGDNKDVSGEVLKFSDTLNPNIERLTKLGIIEGYPDGTFRPGNDISREEAAVILHRLANHLSNILNVEITENEATEYKDSDLISEWAKEGVDFVSDIGVMQGVGEEKFDPAGIYTREQSAATMVRMHNLFKETERHNENTK